MNIIDPNDTKIKVIFAAYSDSVKQPTMIDGVLTFPDENSLRLAKIENRNLISLPSLIDKDCKRCLGSGKAGTKIKVQIKPKEFMPVLGRADTLDTLMEIFDKTMPDKEKLKANLLTIIYSEPNKNKLAKALSKLTEIRQIIFCRCMAEKYKLEIERIRLEQKFHLQ